MNNILKNEKTFYLLFENPYLINRNIFTNFAYTMIKPGTVQDILDAVKIEEVVGEYVQLRKRGANLIGPCPFHNEKTPSFTVSPAKGIYKCFGCGKAGNSVNFLMEHEHYSYPEALRYLARKYSIDIEEQEQTPEEVQQQNEREALYHLTEFAQKYFAQNLFESEKGRAIGLSYFKERGLTEAVIKKFGLGYCHEAWDDFTQHALKAGYSLEILEKTGLTIVKEDKSYDRFRGRVMFPVYSVSGRVLGFSGRILSSEKQAAKYVNSPESEIYTKSKTLYGIFQSKNEISKQDLCYLVEGNVDVVSLFQSGVENTVASSGTSLTAEQVKLIKRYTQNVTILYDGDSAGIKAAMRATDMLIAEGLRVRIVLFPEGEDPDSYAQSHTKDELLDFINTNADNFILFKTKLLTKEAANDPIKKASLIHEIIDTISLIPNPVDRSVYLKECASILGVAEQTLATELSKKLRQKVRKDLEKSTGEPQPDIIEDNKPFHEQPHFEDENSISYQEEKIIKILLNYGEKETEQDIADEEGNLAKSKFYVAAFVVGDIANDELTFENPVYQKIFELYQEQLNQGSILSEQFFIQHQEEEIRTTAIHLLTDNHNVSDQWEARWQIYIPKPDDQQVIDADIKGSLLNFKLRKLEKRIREIDLALKELKADDDVMILLHQKKSLTDIKRVICKTLKQVIVK
ncbi:DNA primase [Bacteroidales bacterium OttesenSCG-928-C19]|nr:DNA primase [Bacteroidales bacterium OttesenSCG-928-C19]